MKRLALLLAISLPLLFVGSAEACGPGRRIARGGLKVLKFVKNHTPLVRRLGR